jgi:hypothetical protein
MVPTKPRAEKSKRALRYTVRINTNKSLRVLSPNNYDLGSCSNKKNDFFPFSKIKKCRKRFYTHTNNLFCYYFLAEFEKRKKNEGGEHMKKKGEESATLIKKKKLNIFFIEKKIQKRAVAQSYTV